MTDTNDKPPPAPIHPEEMTATVDFRIRDRVGMRVSARTTPAGLVAVGIVLLSVAVLVWTARRRVD